MPCCGQDAMDSYNDWFSLYHHSKPSKPNSAEVGSSFTDRVALEHRLKQYEQETERWRRSLVRQTQVLVTLDPQREAGDF